MLMAFGHLQPWVRVMFEFAFLFEDGRLKRSDDMTREELLEVIQHMIKERAWWKNEAKSAIAFGNSLMVVRPLR